MLDNKWQYRSDVPPLATQKLAQSIGISDVLAELLLQRGVSSFEEAKSFFRPSLSQLHNPFMMKGMEVAVKRIIRAVDSNERILIYGDYDVDGTTSVALMLAFFKGINYSNVTPYIPDRYKEGYGISAAGVDYAIENKFSVMIALDCGVKAVELIERAQSGGVDVIVCDHHLPGDVIPPALALLDPKQEGCVYPYKELSGCGIGFKLCQAIVKKSNLEFDTSQLLDLVAISIACDIVAITGENRVLCALGLNKINSSARHGVKILLKGVDSTKDVNVSDLVFKAGPRINAAGRMKHALTAVNLLVLEESGTDELGDLIEGHNNERKELDRSITEEALQIVEKEQDAHKKFTTVVYRPEWHKGVIGIVASRLIESYYRPTVVLTLANGTVSGSVRSVKGFNVYDALFDIRDCMIQFGGHKYAAGLTMKESQVEVFKLKFEQAVSTRMKNKHFTPTIDVDRLIRIEDITSKFYRIIQQMAPFGPENPEPVFCIENIVDTGGTKCVGADKNHLKLSLTHGDQESPSISGIAFGLGKHELRIKSGEKFAVVCTIDQNHWKGNVSLQLMVKDIKFMDEL